MKAVIAGISVLLVGIAAYFVLFSDDPLEALLHDALGPHATVSLNACNLFMTVNATGASGGPIALSRMTMRADMRNYDFQTVQIFPGAEKVSLQIDRKPVTNSMLDQVNDIFDRVDGSKAALLPNQDGIRDILNRDDGSLFFSVMAEIKTSDGETILIAHEDAPEFYVFTQSVEALVGPASYRSTTTYAPGGPSADTLLTGEVIAVPVLQFTLKSEDQAKALGQAFYNYAVTSGCD